MSVFRRCRLSRLLGFHVCRKPCLSKGLSDAGYFFFAFGGGPSRPVREDFGSLRLPDSSRQVGLTISWLVSPAELPTEVNWLANGTYRIVLSREVLPIHSSSKSSVPADSIQEIQALRPQTTTQKREIIHRKT